MEKTYFVSENLHNFWMIKDDTPYIITRRVCQELYFNFFRVFVGQVRWS